MARKHSYLAIITILYLIAGFFHIGAALAGLLCFGFPFAVLFLRKRRTWCTSYCPRSHWFELIGRKGRNRRAPRVINNSRAREIVLSYFGINLLFVTMSGIMVGIGRMPPMDVVRLFILFPIGSLPQLINAFSLPPVLLHLSYRFYSIMLSSLIIGTLLGVLFRPRTWCSVCPVNILSAGYLKKT